VRPAHEPGDTGRAALGALLYLPRKTVELLFLATGTAASIIRDEQIVPRVEELLSPRPGQISVFPAVLFETRRAPTLGAGMIASSKYGATGLTLGFAGPNDLLTEARIRLGFPRPVPIAIALDALYDTRSQLEYLGVGQAPARDPRNHFRSDTPVRTGTYFERRSRAIVSVGARVGPDVELFASTGITKSVVDDPPDGATNAISRVFVRDTLPGAFTETTLVYTELALRLDTRRLRVRPSPGLLLEGYAGVGADIDPRDARFIRTGGRAAAFIPLVYASNILAPSLTLDQLDPIGNTPIPFTALVNQPDFRGFDTHRDRLSIVASIDYRWALSRSIAPRIFLDLATVAPEMSAVFSEPPRIAAGLGFDVFSPSTEIGQFAIAYTSDGFRLLITFGLPTSFGDRQHRY